jgi:putative nucleotidyltransferase with HDIG domain
MFPWLNRLFRGRRRRRAQLAHEMTPVPKRTRILVRALLSAIILVATTVLFPLRTGMTPPAYLEGTVSAEEILAPFDFGVPKLPQDLERERALAAEAVVPAVERLPSEDRRPLVARLDTLRRDRRRAVRFLDSLGVSLSAPTLQVLASPDSGRVLIRELDRILDETLVQGMVDRGDAGLLEGRNRVRVSTPRGEEIISTADIFTPGRLATRAAQRGEERLGPRAGAALAELAEAFAVPDLAYDPTATDSDRDAARASVSATLTTIQKGERIVDAHERITHQQVVVLEALRRATQERAGAQGIAGLLRPVVGRALLVLVAVFLFGMFLRSANREVWRDLRLNTAVTALALLTLGFAAVVARVPGLHPFAVPVPMAGVVTALLMGEAVALGMVVVLAAFLGAVTGWGLPVTLVTAVGGVVAVFSMRRVFQRWEFLRAIVPTAAGMLATLAGVQLVGVGVPGSNLPIEALWTAGNAVLSFALAMFMLPLFEQVFHLASDITLLELSDLNRPIFKRMMLEANGTYHHSMVVGSLAEAAAETIGANRLLARVGGYYHDVGKIAKSDYFGENLRKGMRNPHERLTPTMSSLILESHVREGMELAREVGLPTRVAAFIPEHQGTTLMQYFFTKASEMDAEVDERDYRYPGPKPQSKETAIVMLADAAEATVRSLDEHTPDRIRAVLDRTFQSRIVDGQLDECGLTLADLAGIRDAFIHVLIGVYHGRVKYQWQKDGGEESLADDMAESVFRPELETALGTREAPRGFANPPPAAAKTRRR